MSRPRLLLRTDVSRLHGTGHLMRSHALGEAWRRAGGETILATGTDVAPYREWLGEMEVRPLQAEGGTVADAEETSALAGALGAAWIVADGYHFGAEWCATAAAGPASLLLFDDYGHAGDYTATALVLNQNPSASASTYARRSPDTGLLLGPNYAVLRPQFQPWRTWVRETPERAQRLLVTFGGTDPAGMTLRAVEVLREVEGLEAEIVVGAGNPQAAEIEHACAGTALHVRRNVLDMPALMAQCDFALAAAGTTTLECAFLRLPQLLLSVADNQRDLARALHESGAARHLGWHTDVPTDAITAAVCELRDSPAHRAAMSIAGGQLVDGHGAARVVMRMRARLLHLRAAVSQDAERVWQWANEPGTRAASFRSEPIPWEDHVCWYEARLRDPQAVLWIAAESGNPAGLVRFALEGEGATISIVLAPAMRGRGLGAALVWRACTELFRTHPVQVIHAAIKPENTASVTAFARAGFQRAGASVVYGCPAEEYTLRRSHLHEYDLPL